MMDKLKIVFMRMQLGWKSFLRKKEGQSMTEYILVLAVIAIATILTWRLLGNEIMNKINGVIANLKQ